MNTTVELMLIATVSLWSALGGEPDSTHWNVTQAGAAGDGQADCTAIFQKLLDAAGKAGGGTVEVPAGRFRINGNLRIPANVTLEGIFRVPPTPSSSARGKLTGSVLLAYAGRGATNAAPFIRLAGNNAAVAGLIIAYPEWRRSDVPPVPYPPCIASENAENVGIRDCCLLNPYEGIRLVRAARHLVRNVTGYPIKRGLFVDQCYDIGHIENVHFWPFGVAYKPEDPYCKWINTRGVAFEFARTDWQYVHNTFCFGYGIGYKFSKSSRGSANGNFLGLGADSCERAVVVEQAQPPGLLIANGEFVGRWSSTNSVCLEVDLEAEGKVSLVNCSFWGPIDRCVWMRAPAGQFTANACHFVNWDNRDAGSPALQIDAGKAIIQGSTFQQAKLDVTVSSNVVSAILTANQAEGGFRVRNLAGNKTQSALNEEDTIEWPKGALLSYVINVGRRGDAHYLEGWHNAEKGPPHFRWSGAASRLRLPVAAGKRYALTLQIRVPDQARSPEGGLYLGNRRLAPLDASPELKAELGPTDADHVELEVRCHGWVPAQVTAGSGDARTLGVQLTKIIMRAASAGTNGVFNANAGQWVSANEK